MKLNKFMSVRRLNGTFAILIATLMFISIPAMVMADTEPNDESWQAEPTTDGALETGTLHTAGVNDPIIVDDRTDTYSISLNSGDRLIISDITGTCDYPEWYDPGGGEGLSLRIITPEMEDATLGVITPNQEFAFNGSISGESFGPMTIGTTYPVATSGTYYIELGSQWNISYQFTVGIIPWSGEAINENAPDLTVTVYDSSNGEMINYDRIGLEDEEGNFGGTTSSGEGDPAPFVFDEIEPGIYHVTVTSNGYQDWETDIALGIPGIMLNVYMDPINGVPGVDTDGDGVPNAYDDFPADPAASVDTDGDEMPDFWNPEYTADDSTSNLILDADDDGDGTPDSEEIPDSENDNSSAPFQNIINMMLFLIIIIIVLVIVLVVAVRMLRSKKLKNTQQQPTQYPPPPQQYAPQYQQAPPLPPQHPPQGRYPPPPPPPDQ